jgi:hypothetical protein
VRFWRGILTREASIPFYGLVIFVPLYPIAVEAITFNPKPHSRIMVVDAQEGGLGWSSRTNLGLGRFCPTRGRRRWPRKTSFGFCQSTSFTQFKFSPSSVYFGPIQRSDSGLPGKLPYHFFGWRPSTAFTYAACRRGMLIVVAVGSCQPTSPTLPMRLLRRGTRPELISSVRPASLRR